MLSFVDSVTQRTIGHYEILEKLGEGGMGVVWKARDRVLDRLAAIKVLPEGRAEDSQRRQRFFQEAKAASALNHPNIVTIYEAGSEDGRDYLVMEFIKGRTLAELVRRGPLKAGEVLRYATQMAAALSAAHAAGIVHRDIKPGNVMVTETGLVKVLDFGLAKLMEAAPVPAGDSTVTVLHPTEEGTVMGTAAYMSPEQAEGKPLDARTDVFSLGTVVYELLTGERAFPGDTRLSTMSAVVEKDPAPMRASVPLPVERMVMRCLRKDPARRWQHMADLQMSLEELREDTDSGRMRPVPTGKRDSKRAWLASAAVLALAVTAGLVWNRTRVGPPAQPPPQVSPLTTYAGSEIQPSFSPDGNQVAFSWDGENQDNWDVYVKLIGPGGPLRLTADPAEDSYPAWSPDGKWIAFLRRLGTPGELPGRFAILVVPALGGGERKIGECAGMGLAWTGDGRWLLTTSGGGLVLFSFETGEQRTVTNVAAGFNHRSGSFSPDGRRLAFASSSTNASGLFIASLTAALSVEGAPKPLVPTGFLNLSPVWTPSGQEVIFSRGQPESAVLYRINAAGSGKPEPLAFAGDGAAWPAISQRGNRMVFARSLLDVNLWALELDEKGQAAGEPKSLFVSSKTERCPRFSPDGKRIAFESNRAGTDEIWVCRENSSDCQPIVSSGGAHVGSPAWSPDGNWIAFDGNAEGPTVSYVVSAQGGKPRRLTTGSVPRWSADGKWIYFGRRGIFKIPPSGGEPVAVSRSPGTAPEESPDGRFVYFSGSAGWQRTFLRRVPAGGDEQEVVAEISGRNFVSTESGVWYLTPNAREGCRLEYLDFATKRSRIVARIPRPVSAGLTLSPDRRRIVWTQVDREGSDLMLVENFH